MPTAVPVVREARDPRVVPAAYRERVRLTVDRRLAVGRMAASGIPPQERFRHHQHHGIKNLNQGD